MNALSWLLPLALFSAAASASELPSLKMDLDGDGIPDLVRVLPLNKDFNRLSVTLSRTGTALVNDSLVKVTFDQIGDHDDDICATMNTLTLRRGKGRAFVLAEGYADQGGCSGELHREFLVELGHGILEVTALHVSSSSYSPGDPSPVFDLQIDFKARNAKAVQYDQHSANDKQKESLPLPASCGPASLSDYEKDAIPACAKTTIQKLGLDCGRQSEMTACPVAGSAQ